MKPNEELAACAHEIWAHWMTYLFSVSVEESDGVKIPREKVDRWKRQMATAYADLSEKEKESDREQAIKIMKVFIGEGDDVETCNANGDAFPPVTELPPSFAKHENKPGTYDDVHPAVVGKSLPLDGLTVMAELSWTIPQESGHLVICPCGYIMRYSRTSPSDAQTRTYRCRKCNAKWTKTESGWTRIV